jgi:hypothetical protein
MFLSAVFGVLPPQTMKKDAQKISTKVKQAIHLQRKRLSVILFDIFLYPPTS